MDIELVKKKEPAKESSDHEVISNDWFYQDNEGSPIGPYGEKTLVALITNGIIKPNTMVKNGRMINWLPASSTELEVYFRNPDAWKEREEKKPSSRYAWMLATIPIIVEMLLATSALYIYLRTGIRMTSTVLIIITVALNILFLCFDAAELNRCKKDLGSITKIGFILVPLYLFVRAANTDKNYGYGIVWCILVLLAVFFV